MSGAAPFGPYVPPDGGVLEATIVVKAAPERSKKYGETVCTAAMLDDGRLVRIYPVAWDVYRTNKFRKWTRVRLHVVPSDEPANRPESHKLAASMVPLDSPLLSKKGAPWKARLSLVANGVAAGGMKELRETQGDTRRSLGVVRVRELIDFRITAPLTEIVEQADYRVSEQRTLTGEDIMEGSRIDKVKHVFRYRWRCHGTCCDDDAQGQGFHDTTCEDWELFEAYRSWRRSYRDDTDLLSALKNKFYDELGQTDLHFFMGTPSDPKTQNSWMVVGVFYPFIKKFDPQKPSIAGELAVEKLVQPDAKYDRVENVDGRRAPAKPQAGQQALFDY